MRNALIVAAMVALMAKKKGSASPADLSDLVRDIRIICDVAEPGLFDILENRVKNHR